MENSNKRHIELPSTEGINDLTPQDQLVYLGLRSFINKDTMESFPSQKEVANLIGCCDKTVRKCIKNLIDKEYIKTRRKGRQIVYIFNRLKQFEPFSYDFISDSSLSFTQKALLTSTQQYMYDKESGIGKTSYSKMELAEKINMPYPTLVKATRELQNKKILQIVPLKSKDFITRCNRQEMQFVFQKYHQGIVSVLLNHEERIENNELLMSEVLDRLEQLEKENELLKVELKKK